MGFYDGVFRFAVFLALDRQGILKRAAQLERALDAPLEVIENTRSDMRRHAAATSPLSKERFDRSGTDPSTVRKIEDLRARPLLEKDDLHGALPRIRSSTYADAEVTPAATGGSTASPMPFVRDRECLLERKAGNWLVFGWMGRRPWHRSAIIWGAPRDLAPRQGTRERLALRLKRRQILLPSNARDERKMRDFAGRMRRFRPAYLRYFGGEPLESEGGR